MTVATIDIANLTVAFHATLDEGVHVSDQRDHYLVACAEDLNDLSGPQLVAIYNAICDELNSFGLSLDHTKRFPNKEAGVKRVMANLKDLHENRGTVVKKIKALKGHRHTTGVNLEPMARAYACREGSKQSILVDMLSRKEGATMKELLEALSGGSKPWKEVTVKSGLNWDMNKVKGYGIRTTKRGEEDCYHLVLPKGMTAPLPHTPRSKKGA